jgi:hypothetical protein
MITNVVNSNVYGTGVLASSAATADQLIATYTVTAGRVFQLAWLWVGAKLTTYAGTATDFGTASFRVNGSKKWTWQITGSGFGYASVTPADSFPLAAGDVITIVCTPSAVTPFSWEANFGGTEV